MKAMLVGMVFMVAASIALAKDTVQGEVKATHVATHEDQGTRSVLDKGILGAHAPSQQVEVFKLDTVINGDHVFLVCVDTKGCEQIAPGTYEGELKRGGKWIKVSFELPVTHKRVERWYRVTGSW
jgi:hypothetical protein